MARIAVILVKKIEDEDIGDTLARLKAVAKGHGATLFDGTALEHDGVVTYAASGMFVPRSLNYGPSWIALARLPED